MNVETFECTETAAEPIEASEEALGIINSLDLEGQKKLCVTKPGKRAARSPYREMTKEERTVYKTLCPDEVKLEAYDAAPIPLRVLQIAAHATSLGMFPLLEVWDKVQHEVKDPVLVAWTTKSSWETGRKCFILARWGEVLEPFVVLMKRAAQVIRERVTAEARKLLAHTEGASDAEIIARDSAVI